MSRAPWGYIIKTAVCVVAFLAALAAFAYVCRELADNYLLLLIPAKTITISWLIRLGIYTLLLAVVTGVVAILVRPLWIGLATYLLGALLLALIMGLSRVTLLLAVIFFVFLSVYLMSVNKQLKNQIKYSVHPLSDMKLLLLTLLAILVSVAFGLGYSQDAARRAYVVPPEIKTQIVNLATKQVETLISAQVAGMTQKKATSPAAIAAQKKAVNQAVSEVSQAASQKIQDILNNLEKQAQPHKTAIAVVVGALLFSLLQIIFLLLGFVSVLITKLLFPLLRVTRFTNVATETREVKYLTLAAVPDKKS